MIDWQLLTAAAKYATLGAGLVIGIAGILLLATLAAVNRSTLAAALADELGILKTVEGVCWRKSRLLGGRQQHEPGLTGKCSWCGHGDEGGLA